MRKKETIGNNKNFKIALNDLKTRKHLLLEARLALQKVLDAERERDLFPSTMEQDILDCYRQLEDVVECVDSTITEVMQLGNRPSEDLPQIALEKLVDVMCDGEFDLADLKEFLED